MLETFLTENPWAALAVWAAIYLSDYYLTIYSAHLYQAHVKQYFEIEGSYELTPQFQEDIDKGRKLSPRFLVALVISVIVMALVWFVTVRLFYYPQAFAFLFGGLFLREAMVHLRHFDNILRFRAMRDRGGIEGHIRQARWLTYQISAIQILTFSGFYLLLFLLTRSFLFLGGAFATFATGIQHRGFAKQHRQQKQTAA